MDYFVAIPCLVATYSLIRLIKGSKASPCKKPLTPFAQSITSLRMHELPRSALDSSHQARFSAIPHTRRAWRVTPRDGRPVSLLPHTLRLNVQHSRAGWVLGDECPREVVVIQKPLHAGCLDAVGHGAGEGERLFRFVPGPAIRLRRGVVLVYSSSGASVMLRKWISAPSDWRQILPGISAQPVAWFWMRPFTLSVTSPPSTVIS